MEWQEICLHIYYLFIFVGAAAPLCHPLEPPLVRSPLGVITAQLNVVKSSD